MLLRADVIHRKARDVIRRCGTRDTLEIARQLGIYVHQLDNLQDLLGMYTYRYRERHILLNAKCEALVMQMVCGHELGHDALHRRLAKGQGSLPEFVLFDMRSAPEYEANAFAAHLLIDDATLLEHLRQGRDVTQLAALLGTNINLMLVKLNEMNRMGWQLNLPYVPRGDFLGKIKPEG